MLRFVLPDFIHRDDVRMIEARRRRRFVAKALHGFRGRQFAREDHLHRHLAPEAELPRAIHHAHATARNLFEQFVIAEAAHLPRIEQIAVGRRERVGVAAETHQALRALPKRRARRDRRAAQRAACHRGTWVSVWHRRWKSRHHFSHPKVAFHYTRATTPSRYAISSSTSSGDATVCAISSRSSSP